MTNEEIKKELSKIPEEDRARIKFVENLSNEEMANISGGHLKPQKKSSKNYI